MCTAKNSFSLSIAWRDGQASTDAGREDGLVYDVHMRQVESLSAGVGNESEPVPDTSSARHWIVAAQNLRDCETLVSGLAPLDCYVFRIRAHRATDVNPRTRISSTPAAAVSTDPKLQATSVFSPVSQPFQTLRRI